MPRLPSSEVLVLGRTTFRNEGRIFGQKHSDRRFHTLILGKSGTGKTTLLESCIRQDIARGAGVVLLDPHGDLAASLVGTIPKHRQAGLISFDVAASTPLGFNPVEPVGPKWRGLVAAGFLDALKRTWPDFWGPRLEHILRNAVLALLEQPEATLADILRLFDDAAFRTMVTSRVSNPVVGRFWEDEFPSLPARLRAEAISPIQNKIGAFLADPTLQKIVLAKRSNFRLREVMDAGKILLVNLAKGRVGDGPAAVLGSLLVSRVGLAGLSRADTPAERRRDVYVYLDEFHSMATLTLVTLLSELRKYGVNLILATQFLEQVSPELQAAILGNVGTILLFRLGPTDAKLLAEESGPEFSASDLMDLPNHHVVVRLMIDRAVARPFSASTLLP